MSPADPSVPLPLVSFEELMAAPLEPVPWLVEPLIAEGDRVVVYGEWGAYKSWVLVSLALHLAAGRPWLDKFPIAAATLVLYVDEEMSVRLFKRRAQRLAQGMDVQAEALPLKLLSRHGVTFEPGGARDLLEALKKSDFDPEIIIVETFRRVSRGDEISAKDVAAFWQEAALLVRGGKTLIVSHHMRKPSLNGRNHIRDRASGSTDILAAADSALALTRTAKDAFIVEHVKCREAEEADAFAVSFFEEDTEGPVHLRYEGSPADLEAEGGKVARAEQLVQAFLRSAPIRTARTEEVLAHVSSKGISKTTGERALKKLKKEGRLDQPTGRGSYRLVEQ